MNGMIRLLTLGVMAMACGFGSVFVIFTYLSVPAKDATARNAAPVTTAQRPVEPHHYVINLTSGTEPIEMVTVQHPDTLAKYQIYTRHLTVKDTVWHQLRLGFFPDLPSAEKIANLLRDDFPLARVAPASTQEWTERANAALVALVATDSSTSAIAKADSGRAYRKQPKTALSRAPSAMHGALS
ncbi:MAG: hypothetical protein V3S24_13775 [Candidatus Tectomicrobia bacterium]